MGPIGFPELILIFVVALLLFGPKKLPELGRTIGRAMSEFRRASTDLQRSLEDEIAATELKEAKKSIEDAVSIPNDVKTLVNDTVNTIKSPWDGGPYDALPQGEPPATEPQPPATEPQPPAPTEPVPHLESTKPTEPK